MRHPRLSRETHLDRAQLENAPANRATWHDYNCDHKGRAERQRILAEVVPIISEIIAAELTDRQREVVMLYFHEQNTQVQIAEKLGISQPTVSQHLSGKKRRGKKIGGALRRIRKCIRKRVGHTEGQNGGLKTLAVLDSLLDDGMTRRVASELIRGLL